MICSGSELSMKVATSKKLRVIRSGCGIRVLGTALEHSVAVHRCGVDRERIGGRAGVFVGGIRELAPADAEVCIIAGGRSSGDGSVHDRPLVADLGGVHRRAAPQLGLGGQTGDLLILEHISVGCGDQQVDDAGTVDHTGEGKWSADGSATDRCFRPCK